MVEEIVVGQKIRFESQLSRMNSQTFSAELSSGHLAGSGMSVMLDGTSSFAEVCQAASNGAARARPSARRSFGHCRSRADAAFTVY